MLLRGMTIACWRLVSIQFFITSIIIALDRIHRRCWDSFTLSLALFLYAQSMLFLSSHVAFPISTPNRQQAIFWNFNNSRGIAMSKSLSVLAWKTASFVIWVMFTPFESSFQFNPYVYHAFAPVYQFSISINGSWNTRNIPQPQHFSYSKSCIVSPDLFKINITLVRDHWQHLARCWTCHPWELFSNVGNSVARYGF